MIDRKQDVFYCIYMLIKWISSDIHFYYVSIYFIYYFWRCAVISDLMVNEQIRDKEVRLIDTDGTQLGVLPVKEAQRLAHEKNLDLVKIVPNAKPPVCKIIDYGKYKFEQTKREKEAKKKQKVINVKEIRLSPNIEEHDLNTKMRQIAKFLKNGDKVKVTIRFRGREMAHTQVGKEILETVAKTVSEVGTIDKPAKMEGRNMVMFLMPK